MLWLHLRKLKSGDSAARVAAAHALAERGSRRAVEPLGRALADRGWDDRSAAAIALGKLGNGRALPFLVDALQGDPEVDVRCSCAWSLGRIGGKSVFEPLEAALDDDDAAVRRVATEAIAEVGTAVAVERLGRAFGDAHHDVRLAAVKGMGTIGSGDTAPLLLAAMHDAEWSVRSAAAEALAKLQDSSALASLLEALIGERLTVRLVAAEALGRIGDPRAVAALVAALGAAAGASGVDGCDLRMRRNVAKALGDIGKAEGLPALLTLAGDRYTAGVAVEAVVKVLRWDAAAAGADDLRAAVALSDIEQVPWMVDEAEEAKSGRIVVREGKPWTVDAEEVRAAALAESQRRGDDLSDPDDPASGARSDS